MKKIYITTIVIIAVVLVWLGVVYIGLGDDASYVNTNDTSSRSDDSTDIAEKSDDEVVVENGTTVDSSSMTEGQRKLISALGLNPDNITVTAEMVACAEAKLGTVRVQEIQNGATPSFTEGASLVVCYK